jgi:hypothetical protein
MSQYIDETGRLNTVLAISRFKIKSFLKVVTALHVSACSPIRCPEIRGNCCAFRATAIGVVFTVFLNEVNAVLPSMPHVLPFFFLVCLLCIEYAVWMS